MGQWGLHRGVSLALKGNWGGVLKRPTLEWYGSSDNIIQAKAVRKLQLLGRYPSHNLLYLVNSTLVGIFIHGKFKTQSIIWMDLPISRLINCVRDILNQNYKWKVHTWLLIKCVKLPISQIRKHAQGRLTLYTVIIIIHGPSSVQFRDSMMISTLGVH